MRIDVLGVGFDDLSIDEAVERALDALRGGDKSYIVTPNPEIVWMARRDPALRKAINEAALVLPDGVGIVIGARILGTPLRSGRVPGIDFAAKLINRLAESGCSVFLLGAGPGVAEEAGRRLAEHNPGLSIAGAADGYFEDDGPVIERINAAKPDLLMVCMGAPKQEHWMAGSIVRLETGLCAGLGGALDVFAGKVRRAPVFFRKLGLEWLYRIVREPRRIKRSLKLPLFVAAVIWRRMRRHG